MLIMMLMLTATLFTSTAMAEEPDPMPSVISHICPDTNFNGCVDTCEKSTSTSEEPDEPAPEDPLQADQPDDEPPPEPQPSSAQDTCDMTCHNELMNTCAMFERLYSLPEPKSLPTHVVDGINGIISGNWSQPAAPVEDEVEDSCGDGGWQGPQIFDSVSREIFS